MSQDITMLTPQFNQVQSSWWTNWWFYGAILLIGIVIGAYHWRLYSIRSHNQELVQKVAERTKGLSSLHTITAVVSSTLDLQETLDTALNKTLELMECDAGGIYLFTEQKANLTVVKSASLGPETLSGLKSVPLIGSFLETAVQSGKPTICTDLSNLVTIPFASDGFNWLAVMPLTTRGTMLGALFMVRQAEQLFSSPDNKLLASIGNQIGVAIENARLYEQAQQLATLAERSRLAHDLHDSVTQSIYSLTLLAEAGLRMIQAGDTTAVQQNQERLGTIARQALQEMRLLLFELRSLNLKEAGLIPALEQRLEVVERRAGVDVKLAVSGNICLPEEAEEAVYRIAHEALNNALKHAGATAVIVKFEGRVDAIILTVQDNGCGFDTTLAKRLSGLGLVSMQERTEKLDGRFIITSTPNVGTVVCAEIPLPVDQQTTISGNVLT